MKVIPMRKASLVFIYVKALVKSSCILMESFLLFKLLYDYPHFHSITKFTDHIVIS